MALVNKNNVLWGGQGMVACTTLVHTRWWGVEGAWPRLVVHSPMHLHTKKVHVASIPKYQYCIQPEPLKNLLYTHDS